MELFQEKRNERLYNVLLAPVEESSPKCVDRPTLNHTTSTFSEINANSIWAKLKNVILFSKNSIEGNYEVQTIKLDNYIKEKKINNIDLLKIDTEGHELNVLKGSEKSFDDKIIKYILIEVNLTKMYKNYKTEDIENFLQRKNYKLVRKFKFPLLNFEDRLYVSDKF